MKRSSRSRSRDLARGLSRVNVYSRQPVSIASFQVGVEIHPIATQGRQPIAMPQETRETLELMRRIDAIQQSLFHVDIPDTTPHQVTRRRSGRNSACEAISDARDHTELTEARRGIVACVVAR